MFDRVLYKEIAKKELNGRWTTPVLATLFVSGMYLLLEIPYIVSEFSLIGNDKSKKLRDAIEMATIANGNFFSYLSTATLISLLVFVLAPLVILFFGSIFNIAESYLYIAYSHTTSQQPFTVFIKGFSLWAKGILGFLWNMLWVTLWTFVFIIPGIIKNYAYSQMFFIIAEYPRISVRKAMKLSKILTRGFKGDLFIMDLSFIGWAILCEFTSGIGILWLSPYKSMSFVNAYHSMKAQAIMNGTLTEADFTEA